MTASGTIHKDSECRPFGKNEIWGHTGPKKKYRDGLIKFCFQVELPTGITGPQEMLKSFSLLPDPTLQAHHCSHHPHSAVHLQSSEGKERFFASCMLFDIKTVEVMVGLSLIAMWPLTHASAHACHIHSFDALLLGRGHGEIK